MAMFFFHIRDRLGVIPDREGEDFSTVEEARARARSIARELIAESSKMGAPALNRVFEVMNIEGKIAFTLPFSDAVSPDADREAVTPVDEPR